MIRYIWESNYIKELRAITEFLNEKNGLVRRFGLSQMRTHLSILKERSVNWSRIFNICHQQLFACIQDACLTNRRQAIAIVEVLYVNCLPHSDKYLSPLWLILTQVVSNPNDTEMDDKFRVQVLLLILRIATDYERKCLEKYTLSTINIIKTMLKEKYAPIVSTCCDIIRVFLKKNRGMMKAMSVPIIHALIGNDAENLHVRDSIIQCIGSVVMLGNENALLVSIPTLAKRLLKEESSVMRETIILQGAAWSLDHDHRLEHFNALISLNLIGLYDEDKCNRYIALACWKHVGLKYEQDCGLQQRDVPRQLLEEPANYPPNSVRPNLGCRLLVQRNIVSIMRFVVADIYNSKPEVRLRGAQLLSAIALHAERKIDAVLFRMLACMFRIARVDDGEIAEYVLQAAFYLACFIHPKRWWSMFLRSSGSFNRGHIIVLTTLLTTTPLDQLYIVLPDIVRELSGLVTNGNSRRTREHFMRCKFVIASRIPPTTVWNRCLLRCLFRDSLL